RKPSPRTPSAASPVRGARRMVEARSPTGAPVQGPGTESGVDVGTSTPLGATPTAGGVNLSVFSKHAAGIDLLLFDDVDDRAPVRIVRLSAAVNRTYHYWHVFVPGLKA